jgi:uncharacterized repeat protein (TIGR01451 family)
VAAGAGFEDVGISPDGQLAILTGNSSGGVPAAFIRGPFTAAGARSFAVDILGGGRGAGAVRFLPPGLAPGLTITKSAPSSVASGANLTYTLTYANTGAVEATNVLVRDTLPAGTTFVSASNGGTLNNGVVTWNIGTVPAGTTNQTLSLTVNVNAQAGASVNNSNYTIEASGVAPINGPPVTTTVTAASTFAISGQIVEGSNGLGGVTVTLSGSQSATTTTDANGNYSFAGLAAGGTYTVTPSLANATFAPPSQTFEGLNANQTANFTATRNTFTISGRIRDNINTGLGGVTVTLSGTQSLSVLTAADGSYAFTNLMRGNYTVTPARDGFAFTPPARDFPNLAQNELADFLGTPAVATPAGSNINISVGGFTLNFPTVTAAGTTFASPIIPSTGRHAPAGYTLFDGTRAADITTTAAFTAPVTVCTSVPPSTRRRSSVTSASCTVKTECSSTALRQRISPRAPSARRSPR